MNSTNDRASVNIREQLRQAALPLQALGHPMFLSPPVELSAEEQKIADLAVEGAVVIHYLGERRVELGRRDIAWIKGSERLQVEAFIFRMSFIRELACAWRVSGNAEYAAAARDYLQEFMKSWPRERTGESNDVDNTLTLGIRNVVWCKSLPLLLDSPCFDDDFLQQLADYMFTQFAFLRRNVKSLINWRIFNARDMLAGSLYLAFLEPAAEWTAFAVMVLND